jgi:hypothetical protein
MIHCTHPFHTIPYHTILHTIQYHTMPTMNPPPTLTVDASAIINECEMAEMSPTAPDEMMAVSAVCSCFSYCDMYVLWSTIV